MFYPKHSEICILFLIVFLFSIVVRRYPTWVDWPATKLLNQFTRKQPFTNKIAFFLVYPSLEGTILVSLVWFCWFSDTTPAVRAGLITSGGTAVTAGFIAHFLRYTMQATLKPIFNPALRLHPPDVFGDVDAFRTQSHPNSPGFPSQRTTMFAGLAIAIFLVRADLGFVALTCTVLVECSRVYLGLHYPTDSIGSFSLGAALVLFSQGYWHLELGLWFVRWECASPSTFYACAFLAAYQVATAFHEVRELLRSFSTR